jgi:glutathione S-transferase
LKKKDEDMLRLHGFPVSNYANMVHLALLEKGIPFEYVTTLPSQDDAYLARSPRGKVPCLETPEGFLSETSVILDYLEDAFPEVPLLPRAPYDRAVVRRLMKEIELYIELPARLCYPEALFDAPVPDAIKRLSRSELDAGFAALQRSGRFSPYIAGDRLTLADIVFLYGVGATATVCQKVHGVDVLARFEPARLLLERLKHMPNVQAIATQRDAMLPTVLERMKAKYRQPV